MPVGKRLACQGWLNQTPAAVPEPSEMITLVRERRPRSFCSWAAITVPWSASIWPFWAWIIALKCE